VRLDTLGVVLQAFGPRPDSPPSPLLSHLPREANLYGLVQVCKCRAHLTLNNTSVMAAG
jgi:hypothetical protein